MTLSIDSLYAYITVGVEGEGVAATFIKGLGWIPMVGADLDRMERLKPEAQMLADASGRSLVMVKFDARTDMEIIRPQQEDNGGDH